MLKNAARLVLQFATGLALILAITSLGTGVALAEKKAKSIKTEARFVTFDAEAKTITVRVVKAGKKPKNSALKLRTGKPADFSVKPEGSVLTRTSVTLNGKRADITEISEGQTIIIYWVPHETQPDLRYARKIDMVLSDRELEERDKARMEAEKAAGRVAGD